MIRNLLASIRRAPASHAGVFVALVVAAAMVTTTVQIGGTSTQLTTPGHRLGAAAAVLTGDQDIRFVEGSGDDASITTFPLRTYARVPADLATDAAALDGVAAAVADVSVPLTFIPVGDHDPVAATAHGWSSAPLGPFTLMTGSAPHRDDEIALGAELAEALGVDVGDSVVRGGSDLAPLTVSGLVAAPAGDPLGATTAFLSDRAAADLYGHPGEADLVAVVADVGREDAVATSIRLLAGDTYTVRTGSGRALAEDVQLATQRSDLGDVALGAGIPVVLVALFVVAGAIGLSIAGRRRTFALTRAVGATPGQIRRQVSAELAVLGVLSGVVGYAIGTVMSAVGMRGLVSHGLVPDGTEAWNAPWVLPVACGAGFVVAQLSGFVAARRASRIDPLVALREADVDRRRPSIIRLLLGFAALGGGIALTVLMAGESANPVDQINMALGMLLAFVVAVALLGPLLVSIAELLVRKPLEILGGPSARLAVADVRRRPARVASAVVAVALSISFLGTVYLVNETVVHAGGEQSEDRLVAGSVISAPGGLAPEAVDVIATRPGAGTTIGTYPTDVFLPVDGGWMASAVALTPGPIGEVLDLDVVGGTLDEIGPGEVAISSLAAGSIDVGDTVDLQLADGTPYTATVTALYRRGLGFADAIIPVDAAGGGHLGTTMLSQVLTSGPVADSDVAALGDRFPGLDASSASVANAEAERVDRQSAYLNRLIVLLIAGLAAVTLINTLVTATVERRRSLSLLSSLGATRAQLVAMAGWQTAAVAVIGIACGVAAGAAALLGVTKAITGSWNPYLPPAPVAGFVLATLAMTAAAIIGPTIAHLRRADPS